jgi:hypothetical protein
MKAYGGVDVYSHIFLTSALVGGEWSASRPGRFTTGERARGTKAGLDAVEWRKYPTPVVHPVARPSYAARNIHVALRPSEE